MLSLISRQVVYPFVEFRDPHRRMSMLRDLERTQWLPEADLRMRGVARLRTILDYANAHCAFYRRRFNEAGFDPAAVTSPAALRQLPILTKDDIRDQSAELYSDEFRREELVEAKTGGSTGVSLRIHADTQCQATRNAAAMRSDRWAGWRPGMPVAALWGNPPSFDKLRPWLRNTLYDRLTFLDTMNMTPCTMEDFFHDCERRAPLVLYGHAHSLYLYAAFLRDQGLKPTPPAGIVATSMMLLDAERRVIEDAFKVAVSNRYGCEEVGLIASECDHHAGLHLNIDHLIVEFLDDDSRPVANGEEGNIVVTDLVNRGMPLIRYQLGDRGVPTDRRCTCGRGLPLMDRVSGRVADFLVRRDGSRVAGISLIERTLTLFTGIKQMQIVQNAVDQFVLRIVAGEGYGPATERQLRSEFATSFGSDIEITIELVPEIERTRSGKYRFSICNIGRGAAAPA
jgi:phenylacetate-CoA ligase